jgi:hypothetical protein
VVLLALLLLKLLLLLPCHAQSSCCGQAGLAQAWQCLS